MKQSILKVFNVILIADGVFLLYGLYLLFWPFQTLSVQVPDKILNPNHQVHIGEALVYEITYCKYTDTQATVTKAILGAINYGLPPSTNNVPIGCHTAITRNTIIPVGIAPGTYKLELTATYRVNPVRWISVRHDSETFEVLAATQPPTASASGLISSATSTQPFHTDPVTQEPTQPTPAPTPLPSPAARNLPTNPISALIRLLGL